MQSPSDRPDPMNMCPIVGSIQQIGNEWRLVVVRYLMDRPMRFNELLKRGIDSKTLSRVLKYLQDREIVRRDVVSTQPFSVQYTLTPKGVELEPMIESLRSWGEKWIVPRS